MKMWPIAKRGKEVRDAFLTASGNDFARLPALLEERPEIAKYRDTGPSFKGVTFLHWAASYGREDIAQLLLDKGADINADSASGNTPLHHAAGNNRTEMIAFLIKHGAAIEARDKEGNTPAMNAVLCNRPDALLKLAVLDADFDTRNAGGQTLVDIAHVMGRDKGFIEYIEALRAAIAKRRKEKDLEEFLRPFKEGIPVSMLKDTPRMVLKKKPEMK